MKEKKILGIEKNVFLLGWVSFFTDASSETIYPLLPLFLTNVLKASSPVIGLIEGIAEATASLLKTLSGWLSDRIHRKKIFVFYGYLVSALTKPLFYFVTFWQQVLFLRFFDRVGKGVRTSPRDALISDLAKRRVRGKSFGFHRAMDTAGAIVGSLLAFSLMSLLASNYRLIFLIAAIPAFIAISLIPLIEEKKKEKPKGEEKEGEVKLAFSSLERGLKLFIVVSFIFSLGHFSNAFLILRAQTAGISPKIIPLVYLLFNLVYALISIPAGILSDRIGRKKLIIFGYFFFALIFVGFAFARSPLSIVLLFAGYGIYYGVAEGVQRAFVGDISRHEVRGTAYGLYHTAVGIALFPANVIAGFLWKLFSPTATFLYGALMATVAGILFIFVIKEAPAGEGE
ncbi:MAG: MFS transporter [Acidobacteria bacterium]|nr:MFS transporter [Acidobacteriota bacterium]